MANKTRKQKRQSQPWGYHLIIDAGNCDPVAIRSKGTIAKFAKELVKAIKMVAFGPLVLCDSVPPKQKDIPSSN